MEPDVYLKAIEFKGVDNFWSDAIVSSVKCTLSNDQESPTFEDKNTTHKYNMRLDFDTTNPIRAVAAYDGNNYWHDVHSVVFKDSNGNISCQFKVNENSYPKKSERTIAINEELIGVYGVKGAKKHFISFGFIVKAKFFF